MKIDLTKTHDVIGAYRSIDFTHIRDKYQDPGTRYAFDVLDGKYVTGYHIKLACFRHLRDLQRQGDKDFPYHYSLEDVTAILNFAAQCPEVKTLKPVKLMAWQKFILATLIGWRHSDGDKRYARAIVSVARHQGKTYLMAIITVYSFLIESIGEASQDYLVTSKNFKQTSKILSYIKSTLRVLLEQEPWASLGIEDGINLKSLASKSDSIFMSANNNELKAITWESGQYDGSHFKTAIGDEFGDPAFSDVDKISKITSGQVDVNDKQFIQISTAYPDATVPFHQDEKRIITAMEQDWKRDGDTYC
ncbi:MAG: terminase large subunit, partial [Leuconostoc falkenbergense]|uniref:terminase large subunit domain-containing protein n=1 Tax=Leuconostoc falkenbergense TaxID=2766470 RepID=UPI003BB7E0E5